MALFVALSAASCLLYPAVLALLVVRAEDLGLGQGGVGLFYAMMGVGTLVGGLAFVGIAPSGLRALALAVAAYGAGALCLAFYGVAAGLALTLLALTLFALTNDLGEVLAVSCFQNRLPEALYGRFFSLMLMATGAGGLVGALAGPLLAEAIGVGAAVALLALPTVALAAVFAAREGGLRPALPRPAPALGPEVAAHGLFGVPSVSDLLPDREPGGPVLAPRLRRLV